MGLDTVLDLLRPHFRAPHEQLRALFFDDGNLLLGMFACEGEEAAVDLPVRRIIASALAADATAMILAHNHPSGDPNPSIEDVRTTRDLARLCATVGIRLLDHIVLAADHVTSMRAMRLI